MEARKLYLDTQSRRFVTSDSSQAPPTRPTFYANDVEPFELYFLTRTGSGSYYYSNYSANTIKLAVGVTSQLVSQTTWSALSTAVTTTITSLTAGSSTANEVQKISFSKQPNLGTFAIQFPSRAITVSSVTSSVFAAATHGLYDAQLITLSGFTISGGTFANADYYVASSTLGTFYISTTSGGGTVVSAQVSSGGGTATLKTISTKALPYNATAQDVQTAIIDAGFTGTGNPNITVSGSMSEGFTICYGGRSSNINFADVSVVNSSVSSAAGVSANVSFTTTAFLALVAAGTTSATVEVEVSGGGQKQTTVMACNIADDIIDP